MTIVQQGAINTTALIVPDLMIQIVPPSASALNGVPTNVLGVVGTAQWGPVNAPTVIGNMAQYAQTFGAIQNRTYDMGTVIAAAVLQGANNFRCVRVTDGTDVAASAVIGTTGVTITSKYTGTLGNTTQITLAAGSVTASIKATVAMPGTAPEVFDNIGAGLTGNAVWLAIAAAINQGIGSLRGPSQLVVAAAGASTATPTMATSTLTGGTDGATTITSTVLVGADTAVRSGMYALRNTGCSVVVLADASDSTQWTSQVAYGLSEGSLMMLVCPAGNTIAQSVAAKSSAGIDSYAAKILHGDWVYFSDPVNGLIRLISPQGFAAGLRVNLSPHLSSLNKPLYGVVGTQTSAANKIYASADLQSLGGAGIDVIANPAPGGNYFALRFGRNSSSNAVIRGENYTMLTNYIAATLNAGLGGFIGQLQSTTVRRQAASTLSTFLGGMESQGMIGTANGSVPYSVVIDDSNNPPYRVALGYMQANVMVTYLSVIEYFLVNVEGGQSVTINRQSTKLA